MVLDEALKCKYCHEQFAPPPPLNERIVKTQSPAWRAYSGWMILGALLLPLYGAGLLIFVWIAIHRQGRKYILTNRRVMVRSGFIAKDIDEVNLAHIRSIKTKQRLYQRLLGYGNIYVGTAGTAGYEVIITGIAAPKKFKELIVRMRAG